MAVPNRPSFAFINLSHPDELKDQDTIHYVRQKAMTHVGRMRRMRNTKKRKFQLVFELQQPEHILPDAIALSRVGLETLDPFATCPFTVDAYASKLCSNSKRFQSTYTRLCANCY